MKFSDETVEAVAKAIADAGDTPWDIGEPYNSERQHQLFREAVRDEAKAALAAVERRPEWNAKQHLCDSLARELKAKSDELERVQAALAEACSPEWNARQVGVSEDEAANLMAEAVRNEFYGKVDSSYTLKSEMLVAYRALLADGVISNGWQPIETAPKDGTRISLTNGRTVWNDCAWKTGRPRTPDRWESYIGRVPFEPTLWHSLPTPPVTKEGQ